MRTLLVALALVVAGTALAAPAAADVCLSPLQNHSCGACPSSDDLHVHVDMAGPNLVCASVLGIRI